MQKRNYMNIFNAMKTLSDKRPIFHSEADFQFSLGWELKRLNNDFQIIMERPFQFEDKSKKHPKIELDLLIENGLEKYGIELKYVTKELETEIDKVKYKLKDHMATNLRRYDFYKDISRLEYLKINGEIDMGYAIFLTNVNSYYQKQASGMAKEFNFADGCKIIPKDEYYWIGEKINEKSIGSSRNKNIKIEQQYDCCWREYPENGSYGFKYILLEI